ncbi:hypothetical protein [Cytobacillus sp. IB215665]|uniref:hypothetical protein n=1 Tax=Cytobacillus sp. IB215665 TaxID=3097357 RepID=UPI002A125940|nr:hypothetical protein [Cytobacillus sp. IB215665]MDX8366600.1 hypothetical protein [Cytobacillus sp. IB215665]
MMKYLDENKEALVSQLEALFFSYKIYLVGEGYIDCIVMKKNLTEFAQEISSFIYFQIYTLVLGIVAICPEYKQPQQKGLLPTVLSMLKN